jgi:hypothetical protein
MKSAVKATLVLLLMVGSITLFLYYLWWIIAPLILIVSVIGLLGTIWVSLYDSYLEEEKNDY